jgi:hypothetical protein
MIRTEVGGREIREGKEEGEENRQGDLGIENLKIISA